MARTAAPARKKRGAWLRGRAPAALACAIAVFAGGCIRIPLHRHRSGPAADWSQVTIARPRVAERTVAAAAEEPALELEAPLGPFIVIETEGPVRPRSVAAPPAPPMETPAIAPEISEQESAEAQRETRQNLAMAERILSRTRGRTLSAEQADLAEKIRGFARDARAAAREGDWMRARNLAEKAQLLSQELVSTL
ncbi:MAG: hypothetical protein LAN71_12110 [Acidobacteriia bacterium]|nr:hypothetical protein [Terriglobia bacterium]